MRVCDPPPPPSSPAPLPARACQVEKILAMRCASKGVEYQILWQGWPGDTPARPLPGRPAPLQRPVPRPAPTAITAAPMHPRVRRTQSAAWRDAAPLMRPHCSLTSCARGAHPTWEATPPGPHLVPAGRAAAARKRSRRGSPRTTSWTTTWYAARTPATRHPAHTRHPPPGAPGLTAHPARRRAPFPRGFVGCATLTRWGRSPPHDARP